MNRPQFTNQEMNAKEVLWDPSRAEATKCGPLTGFLGY
jgi:hypothetical protein